MNKNQTNKWPKRRPQLTKEQQEILKDWYKYWLSDSVMPGKFSIIDRWGHKYVAKEFIPHTKVLDIGAGTGSHLDFEDTNLLDYFAMDHTIDLLNLIPTKYPNTHLIERDIQQTYPFPDSYFERVIAIHVLEHLDNLPLTLKEVQRVLQPGGSFSVVIPCEGGAMYQLGRLFTSKRLFEKRYKINYDWLINYDHINNAKEVINELKRFFIIERIGYFPFFIKWIELNLVIGLICKPRKS